MARKIIYIFLLLSLMFMGCEKKYEWDFKTQELNRVVVEGIITNQLKVQEIRLSYTHSELNQSASPLSGAVVRVDDGNSEYVFLESETRPGVYLSEAFQTVINKRYHLSVQIDSVFYEALADIVPVTPLQPDTLLYDSTRNLNRYIFRGGGSPAMIQVHYDWSADTTYCSTYGNCFAQEYFYVLDNTDINEIFGPEKSIIYFPPGTRIIRQKFSLTYSHQQFIRSLLMETEWSGGIFDVQHGNVRTNLSNGALGYFAACMVVSDTMNIR